MSGKNWKRKLCLNNWKVELVNQASQRTIKLLINHVGAL